MKIAVIKLGSRISFNANDTSGGNGEARSIIKMLHGGGAEVNIFTKILKKDNLLPEYKWHDLKNKEESVTSINESGFDALVVLNGNVNFFGGAEDPEQLLNYVLINKFKGPVLYLLCDPALTLSQVWPSVQKKEWSSNWAADDLIVTRTDIIYVTQPHDTAQVIESLKKNDVKPLAAIHFPFEQFPCMNEQIPFNPSPDVNLSYGGTMRNGRRVKKMIKFYFGHPTDLSVEMFGKIELKDFPADQVFGLNAPNFTGAIKYDEMLPKMNKSMVHCVIGDPWYEKINDIPQRLYESIWSNVVTFVDSDLDSLRRVYRNDKVLADFLYVSDRKELSEKIQLVGSDSSLRKQILNDQVKAVNFNVKQYCDSFTDLIKRVIESRK